MDFTLITKAGLTRQEAADIVGVSHVILWKWTKGQAEPREVFMGVPLRRRVEVFLAILDKLIEKGALPKANLTFSKRMDQEMKDKRKAVVTKLRQLLDERVASTLANA